MSGPKRLSVTEFVALVKAQDQPRELVTFKCPMCGTLQNARDLIAAGAGAAFDDVAEYLAFSCVGRFTGAASPRADHDGQPCNWTLGGLLHLHRLEVVDDDGEVHPHFEVATKEEAHVHNASRSSPVASP